MGLPLWNIPAQITASERVLKLLELADNVYQSWTGESFEDGDNRDREPIVGIAQMLQQELDK